ncbi:MAG: hypothetical protein KDA91_02815 [Planctomycetaceae bacterium]|nr:hypothetical protein [Planctomycetaceae bacterium]
MPHDSENVELQVTVVLPDGFYIYSMDESFSGRTSIRLKSQQGILESSDAWRPDHTPKAVDDPGLGQRVEKFFDKVTWSRILPLDKTKTAQVEVAGELTGQFCSSGTDGAGGVCKPIRPPRQFKATLTVSDTLQVPPKNPEQVPEAPQKGSSAGTAAQETKSRTIQLVPQFKGQTDPIRFDISLTPANAKSGDDVILEVKATVQKPWHTFALDQDPAMIGNPTEINLTDLNSLETLDSEFQPSHVPELEYPMEGVVQRVHFGEITWTRKLKCTGANPSVAGTIFFQLCNAGSCLRPTEVEFAFDSADDVNPAPAPTEGVSAVDTGTDGNGPSPSESSEATPEQSENVTEASQLTERGLFAFILGAFGAGLVALLTPCVFPMIPVTVAFFLKQSEKNHKSPIGLAVIYCLGIIGTFTVLGLLVAVTFRPTKLTELANSPGLNLFFAGLFMVFGLMLMGMFELRLPSWLLTWSSKRESTGGVVGALFMAFTFTLVSFTCTFAFVGGLLVIAATGSWYWPIIGMLSFSAAFASPFFFLALFPSMLRKLPKSGGWMNTVKVTMGLVELAFVLKFLSVADIGLSPDGLPRFLDRASFQIGWAVIAAVTGCYLLDIFRTDHDSPSTGVSPLRVLFAIGFLFLGGYISVGVFAAKAPDGMLWQQIAAFSPPDKSMITGGGAFGSAVASHDSDSHFLDFREAVKAATEKQQLLFIDFTGINCTNCRLMESSVLARNDVRDALHDLVQVQIYTDKVPGNMTTEEREEQLVYNQTLQENWYKDVTLPGYAIASPDGTIILSRFIGLDSSGGQQFLQFINAGKSAWDRRAAQVAGNTNKAIRE